MEEVASDMLAFHGVYLEPECGQYGPLSGPRFFSLADRLAYYRGAVRGALEAIVARREPEPEAAGGGTDLTPEMMASGVMAGKIGYRRTAA